MPRTSQGPRLYTRTQGGRLRFYADLRSVGGGREALIPAGENQATTDPIVAQTLFASRLKSMHEQKRDATLLGVRRRAGLEQYAAEHLVKKAKSGRVTEGWLVVSQQMLETAIQYFCNGGHPLPRHPGSDEILWDQVPYRDLASIGVEHVQDYVHWLAEQPNGRGGNLSPTTQRKYLYALSNLFRRAQQDGIIRGVNPVTALMDKPVSRPREAAWLEVWEAALLLEAARTHERRCDAGTAGERLRGAIRVVLGTGKAAELEFCTRMRQAGKLASLESLQAYVSGRRIPTRDYVLTAADVLNVPRESLWRPKGRADSPLPEWIHPLLATCLLTGGRRMEVFGLEIRDVSLDRGIVTFRPNRWRRLKNTGSHRSVPLWPQLREILGSWTDRRLAEGAAGDDLLFPSESGGLLDDVYWAVDAIAEAAGWQAGAVRFKALRHTYCSARLQTLDRGHPVSEFTVGRELGHGGYDLVRRVYGHLGALRHRSDAVEYRLEQHADEIPPERQLVVLPGNG